LAQATAHSGTGSALVRATPYHAMEWRRTGDFRQRARRSDRATQSLGDQQRRRAAARTHAAINEFEEQLRLEQEKMTGDVDDLPLEAEAGSLGRSMQMSALLGTHSPESETEMEERSFQRTQSDPQIRGALEADPCTKRPPSPLAFYHYGSISPKPKSVFAQHRHRLGETTRPQHRKATSCGFYFPGAQFKKGPYGFSMQDPCLMSPKAGAAGDVPVRWAGDAGDARPLTTEVIGHKRNRQADPVISDGVRSTKAHSLRALRALQHVDQRRGEAVLEQARFENSVYEGRWRDPLLDTGGHLPEEAPAERHGWLGLAEEDKDPAQSAASRVLFGLEDCLSTCRSRLTELFNSEQKGLRLKVLEPEQFLRGLVRLGVVREGELSMGDVVTVASIIDPSFDGRINLPVLSRAIAAARSVKVQRAQASRMLRQQHQEKLSTSYSESLPVEVVKVDRECRSLFNFERSFEKFRSQQRALLAHHKEVVPTA